MLRDPSDQNAAGVRSPFLGRQSQKGCEVPDIERHHDSPLFGGQGKHLGIIDAFQVTALVESKVLGSKMSSSSKPHVAVVAE